MAAPRWHTVLFDLDGTLVDTIPLIIASYQQALGDVLGEVGDEALVRSWIGRPLREAFVEYRPERADELFEAYTTWNLANTATLLRPIEGVTDLLDALTDAGVAFGIVTSKRRRTAELALHHAGLTDRIEVLATLHDTERHKPNPEPLEFGLAALAARTGRGREASEAAYVGDAVVDLLAARAAGMAGVAVLWGAGSAAELAEQAPWASCSTLAQLHETLLPS